MHNIAMGYAERPAPLIAPKTKSIEELAMEQFKCPSPLRGNFYTLIVIHKKPYLIALNYQLACALTTNAKLGVQIKMNMLISMRT